MSSLKETAKVAALRGEAYFVHDGIRYDFVHDTKSGKVSLLAEQKKRGKPQPIDFMNLDDFATLQRSQSVPLSVAIKQPADSVYGDRLSSQILQPPSSASVADGQVATATLQEREQLQYLIEEGYGDVVSCILTLTFRREEAIRNAVGMAFCRRSAEEIVKHFDLKTQNDLIAINAFLDKKLRIGKAVPDSPEAAAMFFHSQQNIQEKIVDKLRSHYSVFVVASQAGWSTDQLVDGFFAHDKSLLVASTDVEAILVMTLEGRDAIVGQLLEHIPRYSAFARYVTKIRGEGKLTIEECQKLHRVSMYEQCRMVQDHLDHHNFVECIAEYFAGNINFATGALPSESIKKERSLLDKQLGKKIVDAVIVYLERLDL